MKTFNTIAVSALILAGASMASAQNGTIAIDTASYNVKEEVGTFNLPLVRTGGSSGAVSVTISTTNGSGLTGATAPSDFTALTGRVVSFADGVTSANVPITIFNTLSNEPNETFTCTISTPTGGATLGANSSATLRILDVDTAAPALTLTAPAANAKLPATPTTVNIVGSAKDNKEVAKIELQLNGAAFVNVPFTVDSKGAANFSLSVTAQRGTNIVVLRSKDHRDNVSPLLTRNFIFDDPFVALAGSYNGLSIADSTTVPPTVPSHSSNGFVNVQLVSAGTFTGKLTIDGLVLQFSGFIGNNGIARFGATGADKILVERPNKPGFEIAFVLDFTAKRMTGTVKEFRRSTLVGTSKLSAERAGFSKTVSVPSGYLANNGAYTLVFPKQTQPAVFAAQDYPQGDGVGTATIKADGTVSIAAILADGTKVTASSLLWSGLSFPLYTELYAKAGSLGGFIALKDTEADSDFKATNLFWFRPFQNVQHYPYGWPEGLATAVYGAKYVVSATASSLPGPLAAANANGNAALVFTDGLLAQSVIKAANIDSKDKVTNAPTTDKSFSLTITQSTGLFSGKFTHSDATQPAFNGVIFQKGDKKGGYGHFLSSAPKVRDGTGQAGAVTLTKK
jgi:hypothetical protein